MSLNKGLLMSRLAIAIDFKRGSRYCYRKKKLSKLKMRYCSALLSMWAQLQPGFPKICQSDNRLSFSSGRSSCNVYQYATLYPGHVPNTCGFCVMSRCIFIGGWI